MQPIQFTDFKANLDVKLTCDGKQFTVNLNDIFAVYKVPGTPYLAITRRSGVRWLADWNCWPQLHKAIERSNLPFHTKDSKLFMD